MKRFLTFLALCCLMAAGAWADGPTVYTASAPIDITTMSNGSSQTVLMYAAGNGNSGFVYVNNSGTERFNISGAKSALTDGSKFYEYTLMRNNDGTFTVKSSKPDNKYLAGWPSSSGGAYGPGQLGGNGTYVTSFNAAACTSTATSLEGGNTYTFTAAKDKGVPVQHNGNIFSINNDGTHNVALQFCTFTKMQLVAGNSYSIKSKFSDKTNSHYLCENGSGVTASATFPADNSGYWTYTSDGKFQNLKYTSRYLIGDSGFKSDGTGTAFTLISGQANGTVTFTDSSRSYAVKKDGTLQGGFSSYKTNTATGDWTYCVVLEESGSITYVPYADGEITYGPLDGDTWSVWSGDVPAELSALGSTYNATNLKVIEKYYTFAGAGELNANFKYTSGSKRLDIAGVQVFSSTGVQIGADFHVGMAGNPSTNNGYTVSIPAGGNYIVRYISTANCGGGQNIATNGKVINTFVPESVSELPVQDGKTYYIYNANWNNNDDVQYYLHPSGTGLGLSTACYEEIAYMWTCVKNGAYYNFRNVATGKWLGHKGMNDNAYDFKLATAANSEGCLTLYSVDAQRYMVVNNAGNKFDQSTNAENKKDGWSSDYGFTECSISDLYFSESLASDKVKWLRAANCSNTGYVMTVKDGDAAGSNLHTDATDAAAEGQLFAFVGNQENGFVIYNKKLGNTYTLTAANTNEGTAATWVLNAGTPTKWYLDETHINASSQPGYGITTSSASGGNSLNMHGGNGGDAKFYANGAGNGGSRWQFSLVDGTPTVIHYVVSGTKAHNDANNYIGVLNITKGTFLRNTYVGTDVNGKTFNAYLPKTQEPISISNTNLHGWNYELTGSDGNYTVTYTAEQTDYQYLAFDKSAQWYRIPAIAKAHNGDLVAIYDYRVCHNDVGFGEVDQVMRRSTDGGATWSAETKIADGTGGGNHFGAAYGDPALVADRESDNMTLITVSGQQSYPGATATSRPMVAALYSSDNGQHWSDPVDITSQFWGSKGAMFQDEDTEAASTTFAYSGFFGSGKILQSRITKVGSYYRLYAAMLCRGKNVSGAYVVYSDDMGRNWSLLGGKNTIKACSGSDEPKVEELPDGSIVLSGRKSYGRYFNIWTWMTKPTAANKAGEGFWGTDVQSNQQTNGISVGSNACNGEILLVDVKNSTTGQPAKLMLQSLPSGNDRSNVEIWYKDVTDDSAYSTVSTFASNWTRGLRVSTTSSAYSTMTEQADGRIGFFYEEGPATYCMVYVPLTIEKITDNNYEKSVAPTPALSLETESTVTSSQLSELTITFTGDNAAQVQLSTENHTAYLTPKASTPAQVKAQNGKLKAAGETPAAIEGTITKDAKTDGKFNITFEDEIPAGDYELSIPEGTFLVGTTPVPELTANYTVEEPAPALPPYADLPLTSGVYEIQNSPAKENRGYLVDYTSHTGGPSLAECQLSSHVDKHPSDRNDGTTTSSKWYIHNDNGTYYIVSLSTLGNNTEPLFLAPATANNTVSTYSTDKVALTIAQHQSYTVTGSDGNTYHCYLISNSASTNVYLSAACGTASTSGAVKTDTNGNDGGAPWVFIPCDESTLTTEQVALRDKAIEIINYEIPTAGKVYTIKAHFTDKTDLYLTSNTEAENLLLPMPTEATANQSYWVAEASGNNNQTWKFKSGYGYAMSLTRSNPGLTTGGTAFSVSPNSDGTYCLVDGNLYIGTWGDNDNKHKGFGSYGVGGNCWKTSGRNSDSWTTDYEIVEVTGVKAYLVSCDNTDGGVAPKFSDYAGVATVKNGGYIIVPNGTTLDATNFPAAEISGYTGSVTFNGTTITVTYEATTTPEGFHIYESNGTYSNVSSASTSFRDKWTSTQDAPRFEIFAHENGNSNGSNNMKPDATYANSGIVCYSGNKTNNISGMTVSIPTNGYVITGYSFKVKNYDTGDYSITVSAGESSVNTSSENKTISVSGLSVSSFEIIIDGSNRSLNKGVVLTDFYVTYAEGEHDVEVPATGIYYIYDNNKSGYLYNSSFTSEGPTSLTETSVQTSGVQTSGENPTLDNRLLWYVQSNGTNVITITNGQGTGYKASATDEETHSVNLNDVNWKFTELARYSAQHTDDDGQPYYTDDYPAHFVKLLYCSDAEYDNVFDNAYGIHIGSNPDQYAFNGGFFANHDKGGWNLENFRYADMSSVNHPEDGLPFTKCRIFNAPSQEDNAFHFYYYTQQDEERYLDVVNKFCDVFFENIGKPGYCQELKEIEDASGELEAMMNMFVEYGEWMTRDDMVDFMADYTEPFESKYNLGRLNAYIKTLEIAPPVMGDAYHIAVRGNDYTGNTKYYLKNDGTYTANEAEADVFVLGGSGDETCGSLLVTNNNPGTEGGIHYLQVREDGVDMNTEYKETDNALNLVSMTKAKGENVQSCPAYLYGTFSATNKDGKVLTFDEADDGSWISDAESLYMKDNKTSAIELISVPYPYNKPNFVKGNPDDHEGGYASIWLPFPMKFSDGIEVYKGTTNYENLLILEQVNTDEVVAAGGYILRDPNQTENKSSHLVLPAPGNGENMKDTKDEIQAFVGSTENPEVVKEATWADFKANYSGTPYVLANKSAGIGFYKYSDSEIYLPKGKAIWFAPTTNAETVQFSFGDIVEAIKALNGEATDAEIYDLQGHRLNKAVKGQVNVINGKKVMFK